MRYPGTVNLPFNRESIKDAFIPALPGAQVPEGDGYWLILQGNALVVQQEGDLLQLPCGPAPGFLPDSCTSFCIGLWQRLPLRVAVISRSVALHGAYIAEPFNASGDRLDDATLTLGGMAMQISHWQRQSRHCSRCGGTLESSSGSWGRRCAACTYEHFPAIHPCAIVLVRRGDEFLLARKKEWLPGRYGLVAGFLDMGESLEECAAREVLEETGVTVKNVTYVGSQCWPFPSQLMAGFIADYARGEIMVEEAELEDVRWFSRENPPVGLPPRRSIARWIIDQFMLG